MFITIGNLSQYAPSIIDQVLLANPAARISTAHEAAECINRYVMSGDNRMHEANEAFQGIYGKLSSPDISIPIPNQAMKDFSVQAALREDV